MDTALMVIVAMIVLAAISFLVFGMSRSQGGAEADRSRWAARATLAEMRKEGAGLPSEAAEASSRGEGPSGGQPPGTPIQGSSPPAGADRRP